MKLAKRVEVSRDEDTVSPDYGSYEELKITNQASRCDVVLTKKDSETGKKAQGDSAKCWISA